MMMKYLLIGLLLGLSSFGYAAMTVNGIGVCSVASYTPTTTATNQTCSGIPASTSIAVHCSGTAAFTTPNMTVTYARATGVANQIAVNLSVANSITQALVCSWIQ